MSPRHDLHIVTGKGGTGKTTVAVALACALATEGRRVLVCEVEGRHGITELFDQPPATTAKEPLLLRTPDGGRVHTISVDARDALTEYLARFYRLGLAGRMLDRLGLYDFATSIAPGLSDVLLTGKVYEAVRRGIKGRSGAYDAVVLDAPPTGRITSFLNVHEAVTNLARVGPIHNQADSIMQLFRSDHTVVHLVTLAQDMPVTEALETIAELTPTGIHIGRVVCNKTLPLPLSPDQIAAAAAGNVAVNVPGLTAQDNAALADDIAFDASWWQAEEQSRQRLRDAELSVVELPVDPAGVDRATIMDLAARLREAMPEEVNQ